MLNKRIFIMMAAMLAVVFVHSAHAAPSDSYQPEPFQHETLSSPVSLDCGLQIVEWRASRYYASAMSDEGTQFIGKLCDKAIKRYSEFLITKGFVFKRKHLAVKVSLLPANTLLDGKDFRNLNDYSFRFKNAFTGCCVWGLYYDPSSFLFLRNDPLSTIKDKSVPNKFFARTFLHEMAHVMNHQWEVRDRQTSALLYTQHQLDEEIAEEWISFIGIKFQTETSDEDLRQKGLKPRP